MRTTEIPSPLIKWAGGKRQLLDRIDDRLPDKYGHYYEPFLGGGALFFHLQPREATINDLNRALINLYERVRDEHDVYVKVLSDIDGSMPSDKSEAKAYYYAMRDRYNVLLTSSSYTTETAALMVFINKHCFNGLYRVNAKGAFNVPYNNSVRASFDPVNTKAVSEALGYANLTCGDFEAAVSGAKAGDFVFLDSPYVLLNETTFEAYTKEGFLEEDHRRLAALYRDLDSRGCLVMLTNHDTPLIRELYEGYRIDVVDVARAINSKASKRHGTEVIVTNYLD
ncbi:Dam family site-specific DNA-(adenine-N6)-methyltransferase [Atopobium sp. oral taxon 810]|uniref:DNA adenine methylase n=1 Tax=Atopobium sp. oral taxon 810 TaxID=712158 RepID=UPI000397F21B|nr:Dam family site-specific DNA-(adenine-N6)-methyltransferase [Atopobium sp. oral taxon 810]ERI05129.1 DNA adenine methylase [Atopobium sp. oral taxon 810 str. F0209]